MIMSIKYIYFSLCSYIVDYEYAFFKWKYGYTDKQLQTVNFKIAHKIQKKTTSMSNIENITWENDEIYISLHYVTRIK